MLVLVMRFLSLWRWRLPLLWAKNYTPEPTLPAQLAIQFIANLHYSRLAPIHAPLPPPQS